MTARPWSKEVDTPFWNAKRVLCDLIGHHPRVYDGSWCFGYNYVCSKCASWVDPWPQSKCESEADYLNKNPDVYPGVVCGVDPQK